MIIAELIEQLSKMDLTLVVYTETDTEVGPAHSIDTDVFDESGQFVNAVVIVATEPEYADRGPCIPEVQPGS